jgi:ABC-type uncharacterized transport system ATPase subunit
MNAAVEVENVTKRFASTLALNDVSFTIEQGARVIGELRTYVPGAQDSHGGP